MDRDLEEKAGLLLKAQRAYIDTIKYGNPGWASAAGFQVGSLYEELYQAFVGAPVPTELDREAREVYVEELHKKIRILLEKSMRWYRENLLMVERLGVQTDWAEKTKLAYGKLLKLLDPAAKDLFAPRAPPDEPGPSPALPPAPTTPEPPAPGRRPDRPGAPAARPSRSSRRDRAGKDAQGVSRRLLQSLARNLLDTSPFPNYTFALPVDRSTLSTPGTRLTRRDHTDIWRTVGERTTTALA